MEITLLGAANDDPIGVTNIRAPNYKSLYTPQNASRYELRFIRHREFYGLDTSECAVVQSSRTQEYAMEKGVLNIAQSISANLYLCGFDLVLWKPAETPVHSSDCKIRVEAGSIAMSAHGASMQFDNACARSSDNAPHAPPTAPPPPPPQPPLLPGWRYALTTTFTTKITKECSTFDIHAYEQAVALTLGLTVGTEFSVTTSCAQRRSLSYETTAPSIEVTHTVLLDFSVRDTDAVQQRINGLNETAIAQAADVNVDDVTPIVVAAYDVVPVDAPSPPLPPPPPSRPSPSLPPSSPSAREGISPSALVGIAAGGLLLLAFFAYLAVMGLMKDKPAKKLSAQTIEASASRLPLLCLPTTTPRYCWSNVEASDDRLESA